MKERIPDALDLLAMAFDGNLVGAVDIAVDEHNFSQRLNLSERFAGLLLSAGIHPHYSYKENESWDSRFAQIIRQSQHASVLAVGESGLDFYRKRVPQETQESAFRSHLDLAAKSNLPLVVHNRDADDRILTLIRGSDCRHGVLHCFSSSWNTAKAALDLGFYISIAGNITYQSDDELLDAATRVPIDRLLLETDAPYLSPQPRRKGANHPGLLGHTLEFLARLRAVSAEKLAESTAANAKRLFTRPAHAACAGRIGRPPVQHSYWAAPDSNQRPRACQARTLTN